MRPTLGDTLRSLLICGGTPIVLGACTMVGGGVRAGPAPRPVAAAPAAPAADPRRDAVTPVNEHEADRITAQVVDVALQSIGTPYEWGGTDANGFDCSGLIRFAYGTIGVRLPRTSADQLRVGVPIQPEPARLRRGDVLGFSDDGSAKASHVGLYIGADQFIHSSSSGVRISTLRSRYWRERLVAVRRPVA